MKNKKITKFFVFAILLIAALPLISAVDIRVTKSNEIPVYILELNKSVNYILLIDNSGNEGSFQISSLVDVQIFPGQIDLQSGENKLGIRVTPGENLKKLRNFVSFEYQIKAEDGSVFKDKLLLKIVSLKDVFEVAPKAIKVADSQAVVNVKNIENISLDNVKINIKSDFFAGSQTVSFGPYESKDLVFGINKNILKNISSGSYPVTIEIIMNNAAAEIQSYIQYEPKEIISSVKASKGLIIRETKITNTNEGNVNSEAKIEISKDILTRLFTIYSQSPMTSDRNGLVVRYTWSRQLSPGESFSVAATTNYTLPFIFIILVILIAFFSKIYSQTNIILDKKVYFVKTKGGQFALKVRLNVRARKHVDNIQIIDSLPGITQLYEKFGTKPDKFDSITKRMFWNINQMNKGEERVYSYILYTKVKVVGRFELPSAVAVYEKDGKTYEDRSNRAFFLAETTKGEAY